jgi:hypothetical protein
MASNAPQHTYTGIVRQSKSKNQYSESCEGNTLLLDRIVLPHSVRRSVVLILPLLHILLVAGLHLAHKLCGQARLWRRTFLGRAGGRKSLSKSIAVRPEELLCWNLKRLLAEGATSSAPVTATSISSEDGDGGACRVDAGPAYGLREIVVCEARLQMVQIAASRSSCGDQGSSSTSVSSASIALTWLRAISVAVASCV